MGREKKGSCFRRHEKKGKERRSNQILSQKSPPSSEERGSRPHTDPVDAKEEKGEEKKGVLKSGLKPIPLQLALLKGKKEKGKRKSTRPAPAGRMKRGGEGRRGKGSERSIRGTASVRSSSKREKVTHTAPEKKKEERKGEKRAVPSRRQCSH